MSSQRYAQKRPVSVQDYDANTAGDPPDRPLDYTCQPDWDRLQTQAEIRQALTSLVQGLGFDCASLNYAPVGQLPNSTPGPVFPLLTVGEEQLHWLHRWRESDAHSERNPLSHTLSPTWRRTLQHTLPQRFRLGPDESGGYRWSACRKDQAAAASEAEREAQKDGNGYETTSLSQDAVPPLTLADQRWLQALWQQGFQELCVTPVHLPGREYVALSCLSHKSRPMPARFTSATEANLLYCVHRFARLCLNHKQLQPTQQHARPRLSRREQECLYWASQGKSAVETATILQLRPETVRTYLKTLLKKLQAENKPQAVAIAYETGLLGQRAPRL